MCSEPETQFVCGNYDDDETLCGKSQQPLAPNRYKTELCRPFEELGRCRYGDKCQFAHGQADLRSLDRHPKHKTELCRTFHSTGLCPYGSRCHFIHNEMKQVEPPGDGLLNLVKSSLVSLGHHLATHITTSQIPSSCSEPGGQFQENAHVTAFQRRSPPCRELCTAPTVVQLELELGTILQRRRQFRDSTGSSSYILSSGSSAGDSNSSSPTSSYLDDALSPTFSPSTNLGSYSMSPPSPFHHAVQLSAVPSLSLPGMTFTGIDRVHSNLNSPCMFSMMTSNSNSMAQCNRMLVPRTHMDSLAADYKRFLRI